jgi:DNA topoisomerase-1
MSAPARKTEYLSADPLASAAEAGLRYVSDSSPGIRRLAWGKGLRYVGPDGRTVKEKRELERIRALVIPPAWTNVWICPIADGHLQAVGWDAKGRKQYRYHRLYRAMRDEAKFGRMIAFGTSLAIIRRRIEADLARQGLPREKVLATVVRLLEATSIRVGNDEYAKDNDSFGLTTMRDRHASIEGARLTFRFKGKSGVAHQIELNDSRLARIVKRCQDLPGYELFQYMDSSGEPCRIDSGDVNRYIRPRISVRGAARCRR